MSTAFVLAGGGSFGAVQVGMLRELLARDIVPDLIVGSSVGAINGAYLAGAPTASGVAQLERVWRGLSRREVFPLSWRSVLGLATRRDFIVDPGGVRQLLEANLPYREMEQAAVALHVVATDLLGGAAIRLSTGAVVEAVLASCAIPGAFPPVRIGERYLIDGAVASNTPIRVAIELGAARLIVLPTGFACSVEKPPRGAIASLMHAVNLLVAHQLVGELEHYGSAADIVTVPPLCPLSVSPYDFSHAGDLIERAAEQTRRWLERGGLRKHRIPGALRPHEPHAP
ncbi:MAG TPA: patatin-like phospholipase family protein [Burkholderiales bacterium]|nr:patatin-like phospholipase family protein [Burkholderiales bacterium]